MQDKRFVARLGVIGLIGLVMALSGCASTPPPAPPGYPRPYQVLGKWYQPVPHARGFHQQGVASWYGSDFHGLQTANGEAYDMYAMTAAHKTLPLGTRVEVTNLTNHRQVQVRINDRGPFVRGRIIDLSYTAAKKIGMVDAGTAPVELVAVGAGNVDFNRGNFTFQVGSFRSRDNAQRFRDTLSRSYPNAHITVYDSGNGIFYRVRVGHSTRLSQAEAYERELIGRGLRGAFTVAE
jgi:rare lipoprotein A